MPRAPSRSSAISSTPPIDILKLFVPHKATAIVQIMNGIESLADFNQRLGRHMASQPALEPIQAVLCDMLRSGTDFATNTRRNPLGIATQALRHVCSTPDDDATVFKARTSRKTTLISHINSSRLQTLPVRKIDRPECHEARPTLQKLLL